MAEQQTPHPSPDALAKALREHLPPQLHPWIAPLAALLADWRAGSISPEEVTAQLRSERFTTLRQQLAGQILTADRLVLDFGRDGDEIRVGDISQSKGVALGGGANAQVVEGYGNAVAGPGGIAINISLAPTRPPATARCMVPDLPPDFVARPAEFERIVAFVLDGGVIRLHDVVREYLERQHRAELATWHGGLLDALRSDVGGAGAVTTWAHLTDNASYAWDFVGYHLEQGGKRAELVAMVKDLRYLARKSWLRGVIQAEADIRRALAGMQDSQLSALEQQFCLSSHLLGRCSTFAEVMTTLGFHLARRGELRPLAEQLAMAYREISFASLHTSANPADPALLRTFEGHTDTVRSCAFGLDSSRLLSASSDRTLKLWDAASAQSLATLHLDGAVTCCAFAPDRRRVAASGPRGEIYLLRIVEPDQVFYE